MSETKEALEQLMQRYRTENLVGISPEEFEGRVKGFLKTESVDDDYLDPNKVRSFTRIFHWGHNHDFGAFQLGGEMGDRHLQIMALFVDEFGLPMSLAGQRVLDIGCWTGGFSLLLAAMGADVVAVEEVTKYAPALEYLATSFGVSDSLDAKPLSIYECTGPDFKRGFDYVLMAGVLYHLTDPVVALRVTFNCLRVGGQLLLETMCSGKNEKSVTYYGYRSGCNWFVPSESAVVAMLSDVGYATTSKPLLVHGRLHITATKTEERDMVMSGLSRKVG